jgi:uncharacterized protein with gpF-like domain
VKPSRKNLKPSNRWVARRAIHPNLGVQAWYDAQLRKQIDAMERDLRSTVLEAYGANEFQIMYVGDAKSPSLFIRKALDKWGLKWTNKLNEMSEDMAERFATRAIGATQAQMKAAFREANWTVTFQASPAALRVFQTTVARNVGLIKTIAPQYLKDVEAKVWNAVTSGSDLHTLSKDLKASYGITTRRAALIARDQNSKANADLIKARDLELGLTRAVWQHSHAGKEPRPTHKANDGRAYNIKTGWYDPDANGPGKGAYIQPGQLINCRCSGRAIIPAFE